MSVPECDISDLGSCLQHYPESLPGVEVETFPVVRRNYETLGHHVTGFVGTYSVVKDRVNLVARCPIAKLLPITSCQRSPSTRALDSAPAENVDPSASSRYSAAPANGHV